MGDEPSKEGLWVYTAEVCNSEISYARFLFFPSSRSNVDKFSSGLPQGVVAVVRAKKICKVETLMWFPVVCTVVAI